MGNSIIEFGPGELRIVGGDYGELEIEACDEAGRRTIEKIVGRARRGGGLTVLGLRVDIEDREEHQFETRHAGLAGTHERGADYGAGTERTSSSQSVAAEESRVGQNEDCP